MAHRPDLTGLQRMLKHALFNARQQGLVCSSIRLRLSGAFQPVVKAGGEVVGREALLRATASSERLAA